MLALLVLTLAAPWAVQAQTVIERGDILSVTVVEDTSLSREAKVNVDGQIVLPQLGGIDVAGSDLETIRLRIEKELKDRDIILTPNVIVDVAQYRPFYVGGAVARPGSFDFEPGLTVRHALVLAGGVARTGSDTLPTPEELDDLKAKFQEASYRLMQTESLMARLTAEMGRVEMKTPETPARRQVPVEDAQRVVTLDEDILQNRIEEWNAEQAKLKDMVKLLTHEVEILQKQSTLQQNERELHLKEVEATRALYEKGLVPLPRLQEMEREASKMSRDLLETEAFEARALQNKAAAEHDLASSDTMWHVTIQRDLRDAELQRAELRAELAVIRERMMTVGLSVQEDGSPIKPVQTVTIHRKTGDKSETIPPRWKPTCCRVT